MDESAEATTTASEELAQAITAARGDRTKEAFAAMLGCSLATVIRWENGTHAPRSEAHIRSLEAEGVPTPLLRPSKATADAGAAA